MADERQVVKTVFGACFWLVTVVLLAPFASAFVVEDLELSETEALFFVFLTGGVFGIAHILIVSSVKPVLRGHWEVFYPSSMLGFCSRFDGDELSRAYRRAIVPGLLVFFGAGTGCTGLLSVSPPGRAVDVRVRIDPRIQPPVQV